MKRIITAFALVVGLGTATAGGYLTNTNQSVAFLRNPARNASTEIDAIYSNPAGMAFLPSGLHFSVNGQSAFQTRTINATFAPFALNADGQTVNGMRTFEGKASAPFIPSISAAYKRDRWTFGAHFAISGGGGKASFNSGLPSFEAPVAALVAGLAQNASLQAVGQRFGQYQFDTYMEGRQYIFGFTLGAAYRISDDFSAYLGLRANYMDNHYEGYLRNIQVSHNGTMKPLSATLSNISQALATAAPVVSQTLAAYARATGDKELNVDQSGLGLTPIIGVNYRVGDLHLAARYEFKTSIKTENKTKQNTTGLAAFEHGVNTPNDIPALLSLGAQYSILPSLRVSAGYHHYFDKEAGMSGDKQKTLEHGTHEYLLGAEYDINERLTVSAGGQLTNYGLSDAFQQDLSFSCDSYSIGLGGAYRITPKIRVNVAYFLTSYSDYTKVSATYVSAATGVAGKDVYSRTNNVFGVGVDFTL